MARKILNNGENKGVIRNKINDNFTELYESAGNNFNWRGEFQLGNTYNTGDVVIGPDGNDYIAVSDGVVLPPPSPGWDTFIAVPDGKSAYDIWLDQGNEGTVQNFLDSLIGADGERGDRGDSGVTVPTAGFFTMYIDENSDLYAIVPTGGTVPLEYDPDTGNLYYLAWRGDTDGNDS